MTEETLFHQALETPAEERGRFLDRACGSDIHLRRRLEALLQANDNPGDFLRGPAVCATAACLDHPPAGVRRDEAERPGARVGPYKLLQLIGEGGMGAVWMADQEQPVRRKVALKLIKPGMDTAQVVARFEQERQALALMDHPNIARVLDAGATAGGRPFFVMELVKGTPITKYCDEHHLTVAERLRLFVAVCQAVQHAHQKGVIHRDLKPSNVLIAPYDGKPVVKVIDFGVSKAAALRLTERTLFTEFGAIVGTLEYMSPEQAELNNQDVDTRSDIYSLGVLLYELLTGTTPFERKRLEETALLEVLRLIREEEPPPPSTRLSTADDLPTVAGNRGLEPRRLTGLVRGDLDWIVMKALEKDRNRRYETANALATDILCYLNDEPVQAGPPSAGYRIRKFLKRHRRWLVTAAVFGVALLLAVGAIAGSIGWAARDRASRLATIEGEIGRALKEVERLHQECDAPGAKAALGRAEALLNAGASDEERRREVSQWRADLGLAARLEDIRLQQAARVGGDLDLQGSDPASAYREAFCEYGIDVGALDADEAARRIRASAVKRQLVSALHDWAWGKVRLRQGGWERLIEVARKADPDPWRDRFLEAFVRKDRKVLVEMARDAKAAELPPPAALLLGRALNGLKETAAAVEMCERVQRQHPGDLWLNLEIASLLLNAGKKQDAVGFLRAFLALRSGSASAFTSYGVLMGQAGKVAEAEAAFHEALRLQPDAYLAHSYLGQIRASRGQLPEAEAAFRKSVALCPGFCYAQYGLGSVLAGQGKLAEAVEPYREAIRLRPEPEYAFASRELADILSELGKFSEAVAAYEHAIKLQPGYAEAHCNLGGVLLNMGRFGPALEARRRGHELGSKRKGWSNPSAAWVKEAERMVELDRQLPAVLKGEARPKDQNERLGFAILCARKQLNRASFRLYHEALAAEPSLADAAAGEGHRYSAACVAALAGSGKGEDAGNLPVTEREGMRQRALAWLEADLEACGKRLDRDASKVRPWIAHTMRHWLHDPDFAGVRGEKALEQLPEEERSGWRKLWQEVEALGKKAALSPRQ
jgi:serine/threonine protein kinase/Flp pilus assembly protein TadD